MGGSVQSFSPLNSLSTTMNMNLDTSRKLSCCPKCASGYEQELARLKESEKSRDDVINNNNSSLPLWMQTAKTKDQFQVSR